MNACQGLLRERVDRGDVLVFGTLIEMRTPAVIEAFAHAGYDAVLIDREHSAFNDETVMEHIRVARCLGLPSMVRVCEDCYHEMNRTLDQAPDGIFIPRIRSREQVEQIMRTVRYPPRGLRGLAGSTCPIGKYIGWKSTAEQIETVNRNLVVGVQIETAEALADLEGILSVEGLDIALVGGDDLSMSMGIPGQTQSPEFLAAVERVIEACGRHGVLPGIASTDPQRTAAWIGKGMKVIWYACEIAILWQSLIERRQALRSALGESR